MNQEKIGKFISNCRKQKGMTQAELAEKLNITDRAVSKWETGKGMPDSSMMLPLCKELGIRVNDLLNGEKLSQEEYPKKAEEKLLEFRKMEEEKNKLLLQAEMMIGFLSTILFLGVIFLTILLVKDLLAITVIGIIAFLLFIIVISFALKIETLAGYYECQKCHHTYIPEYKDTFFAMHAGTTRYLKCPKCHQRSWSKKVISSTSEEKKE